MNFLQYLETDQATLDKYLEERWVTVQHHDEFPLDIYTYGRTCQYEGKWDNITSRCRGVIVSRLTGEIVARPFEKFFNYESANRPETAGVALATMPVSAEVIEKMDGFMCTLYEWEGKEYIASKGSFKSPHAKWATAWYREHKKGPAWPSGWTPVFEGITSNLRIVVDYGKFEGLVLLGVINKSNGEEMPYETMSRMAQLRGFTAPRRLMKSWMEAATMTLNTGTKNEEGFVVTFYLPEKPPVRVKLKYIDYLRLHRIVSGVSPKHIWEALKEGMSLDEWENDSTQWFAKFVAKWKRALTVDAMRIEKNSKEIFEGVEEKLSAEIETVAPESRTSAAFYIWLRKMFAEEFKKPENKEFAPVLFALLDGKDIRPIIWKMTKRLIIGSRPMIDAHAV